MPCIYDILKFYILEENRDETIVIRDTEGGDVLGIGNKQGEKTLVEREELKIREKGACEK